MSMRIVFRLDLERKAPGQQLGWPVMFFEPKRYPSPKLEDMFTEVYLGVGLSKMKATGESGRVSTKPVQGTRSARTLSWLEPSSFKLHEPECVLVAQKEPEMEPGP